MTALATHTWTRTIVNKRSLHSVALNLNDQNAVRTINVHVNNSVYNAQGIKSDNLKLCIKRTSTCSVPNLCYDGVGLPLTLTPETTLTLAVRFAAI